MPELITEKQLLRFQENLPTFRKLSGCSAEDFAELIGLTRQSVTNLETGKTPFTPLHYRAILHLLSEINQEQSKSRFDCAEASSNILPLAMMLLMEQQDIDEADYAKCKKIFAQLATLMNEGVADDPLTTLHGLMLSTFNLTEGDIIPSDALLATIRTVTP